MLAPIGGRLGGLSIGFADETHAGPHLGEASRRNRAETWAKDRAVNRRNLRNIDDRRAR